MSLTAAVITVGDRCFRGERPDTAGPAICEMLREQGLALCYTAVIPDDAETIKGELIKCADEQKLSLVLTLGGTGFSPREITPEATRAVLERETPGIPEAMRAEGLKSTPRACLSRGIAGIRGSTLIVNLPGRENAARESLGAVLDALTHAAKMLASHTPAKTPAPSPDVWLREAKREAAAAGCGMYLLHNGVVRATARAAVREGQEDTAPVRGMCFSYDAEKVESAKRSALAMPGIQSVRVWLNSGELAVGDDIMLVLVGGDIRPHVIDALQALVGELKQHCVTETELH